MTASISAQDQIAAFIAEAMPEQILSFKYSAALQARIKELVERKKEQLISSVEAEELEKYLTYDLLIGLAKARAVKSIKSKF